MTRLFPDRTRLRLLLSRCILAAWMSLAVLSPASAAALDQRLPGGRAYYVVSMASLTEGSLAN